MPYNQIIDSCLAAAVGAGGLGDRDLAEQLAATAAALDEIRREHARPGGWPLLGLPRRTDDLPAIRAAAAQLGERCRRFVVLGSGGSSLGGQCIADLAPPEAPPFMFLDGLDGATLARLVARSDLGETGFIVISKSGSTVETLAQAMTVIEALTRRGMAADLARHLLCVAEPGGSVLRQLAERFALPILDHDPALGGRYAVLSVVGALPAVLLGLDPLALRAGAAAVLERTLGAREPSAAAPALGAALAVGLASHCGAAVSVLMPYADRLRTLGLWYCQLWAESLGKGGRGTTPLAARGPADQHSLLQLFLDGPPDKWFTVVIAETAGEGPLVSAALADAVGLGYLAGRAIGDIVAAQAAATVDTLVARRRPTRVLRLAAICEETLGALFMHFMLETIIAGRLLGVNPFDQPAVEEGKSRTRARLARP